MQKNIFTKQIILSSHISMYLQAYIHFLENTWQTFYFGVSCEQRNLPKIPHLISANLVFTTYTRKLHMLCIINFVVVSLLHNHLSFSCIIIMGVLYPFFAEDVKKHIADRAFRRSKFIVVSRLDCLENMGHFFFPRLSQVFFLKLISETIHFFL